MAMLVAACGDQSRTARLAPPRLPADAPAIRTTMADSGGGLSLASGGMTPGASSGDEGVAARLERIEADLRELQAQFKSAEPAISRLVRIDGDIRSLLTQMERVVAVRAQEAPGNGPGNAPRPAPRTMQAAAPQNAPQIAPQIAPLAADAPLPAASSPGLSPAPTGSLRLSPTSSGAPSGTSSPPPQTPALNLTPPSARPVNTPPANAAPPAPTPPAPVPRRDDAGIGALHLASYRDLDRARDGWRVLSRRYPQALGGLIPMIVRVNFSDGRGDFLRLQASGIAQDEAPSVCAQLTKAGQYCVPAADEGEPLRPRAPGVAMAVPGTGAASRSN
ncbi:MAG: hypothetical protein KJ904_18095 [Alphaproteobacteria bacterium]|nr:hypothetical protein [Alphaproteobacteria bacterium]MBU0797501.1 hypothetical protein [Alphaproteobacteria bacterium]MBU0889070.1 hypothetical protein [Alphaproteobacteria bacterium]MBU1813254.1 hypothetical protein [Alphaproteobacteria bacterium]MBU2090947.1 hypothetical protein [Alphaproteobacteria bacterium]